MADITKTPAEYAKLMLDLFYGQEEFAQAELFEAAKAHPQIPNKFWRDVSVQMAILAARRYGS